MRDLYMMFRDGIVEDAMLNLHGGRNGESKSAWHYIPKQAHHVGRNQTMALIRRFMKQCCADFPGGFVLNGNSITVEPVFLEFVKTHKEMGTPPDELIKAWSTMHAIAQDVS